MRMALMQGRLLPPAGSTIQQFPGPRWTEEFPLAAGLGLDAIEWIVDSVEGNPFIAGQEGLASIQSTIERTGVTVASVCADIFMEKYRLAHGPAQEQESADRMLADLLHQCGIIGAVRIVLPFVDASELDGPEALRGARRAIEVALPTARREGVELHLETSLSPSRFASLLDDLDDPMVKVNYDMGNSAALGYSPAEEFSAYGSRIGSVHIKDRIRGGTTVSLGTGSTDFPAVFEGLRGLHYEGDYVLQVARAEPGDEVGNIRRTLEFVREYVPEPHLG
jgi:L-ribulose-5-phosphate 3-epimerase